MPLRICLEPRLLKLLLCREIAQGRSSLISLGLRPYSLSEGVAIGNATTGGGRIGEGTRCGGFGC